MNDINIIPCKQLKCVVYPVCKHKTLIECLTLSHFLNVYFRNELKIDLKEIDPVEYEISDDDTFKFWSFVRKYLPSAESVTIHSISSEDLAIREVDLHMTLNKYDVATFRIVSKIKKEIVFRIAKRILENG